jgi:hypothetical protein
MIRFLSGAINGTVLANPRPDLGLMLSPGMGNSVAPLDHWLHGLDNGCFAQGASFDPGNWLEWLAALRRYRERCLFAVAPDVIGDAEATLIRSLPYLPTIRQLGFPAAFVSQNGCRSDLVPWDQLDVLFVGGDDAWKLGEASWGLCAEAKRRGKRVHVGRVNSYQRLAACAFHDADSADGTYLAYGPDANWPKLMRWLDRVNGLDANPVYVEARERHEAASRARVTLMAAPDTKAEQLSLEPAS